MPSPCKCNNGCKCGPDTPAAERCSCPPDCKCGDACAYKNKCGMANCKCGSSCQCAPGSCRPGCNAACCQ